MTCAQYRRLPADEKDPADYDFRRLASEKRYVRCPQCRHYIEHAGGCYHMVCRCGRSFNYLFNPSTTTAPQA
jgi:E3 ubiquitin-protein ligase RNF144